MVSVDVVIVNWNTGRQLHKCLNSIAATQKDQFELRRVVVADNASSDGSADGLEGPDLPLTLLRNSVNRGFAAASNQGASGSTADYLLFLNPDTVLYSNSLAGPVVFMETKGNERIGVAGIQLVDEAGQVFRSCARFPTPAQLFSRMLGLDKLFPHSFPSFRMTDWNHASSRRVDQVTGAFFLVRRVLFEAMEGFDERFFLYMEELDFSYRIWQEGWSSHYLAEVRAFHRGGGASERDKAARLFHSTGSRILYGYKHFGRTAAALLMLGSFLIEPAARLGFALVRLSPARTNEVLKAYARLWRDLPRLLRIARTGHR